MIPDIGVLIAAYVVFRVVDIVLSTDTGGTRAGLPLLAKGTLIVFGAVAMLVAVFVTVDLFQKSSDSSQQLEAARRALESLPRFGQ